jgi:hypothetical protein
MNINPTRAALPGIKSRRKMNKRLNAQIKWQLFEYECDNCDTGVVQIHMQHKRGGIRTDTVSGCLDCKKDFGIGQASKLKPLVL